MSDAIAQTPSGYRHIFVVSGPSGAGKASVMDGLCQSTSLTRVVTFATRPPRPSERDGIDYRFITAKEFATLEREGQIAEQVQVYGDYHYGSPRLHYDPEGTDRLIELDTEGRKRYAAAHSPHLTSIFLLPPSFQELRRRIESRHRETNLDRRLAAAIEQIGRASEYDYVLVNDDLDATCRSATAIVRATQQRLERDRMIAFAETLRRQFQASVG